MPGYITRPHGSERTTTTHRKRWPSVGLWLIRRFQTITDSSSYSSSSIDSRVPGRQMPRLKGHPNFIGPVQRLKELLQGRYVIYDP